MRLLEEEKSTANRRLHKRLYRTVVLTQRGVACSFCPPNGGENAGRKPKYRNKKAYELDPKRRHK